jgi:hypothetical protein
MDRKWEVNRPIKRNIVLWKTYEAIALVRDSHEGVAYIANEEFIQSGGSKKTVAAKTGARVSARSRRTFYILDRDWRREKALA